MQQISSIHQSDILDVDSFNSTWLFNKTTRRSFERNWDPHQFNWEKDSGQLCRHHKQHIDIWWNEYLFNWNSDAAVMLIEDCRDYSNIWWPDDIWSKVHDSQTRTSVCMHLIFYFAKRFDEWWLEEFLLEPAISMNLAERSQYPFDKWWNKDLVPQTDKVVVKFLAKYCMNHFEKWYKPICYNQHIQWDLIYEHGQKFKHIWMSDYVAFKLDN